MLRYLLGLLWTLFLLGLLKVLRARLSLQIAALLYRGAALAADAAAMCRVQDMAVVEGVRRRGMGDVLGVGVLATDLRDADVGGFAGFAEGVVSAVEVLALLGDVLGSWRVGEGSRM
jgi:hypothetical protein